MDGRNLARAHRRLRIKHRLRQVDIAERANVSTWKVRLLEAGQLSRLRVGEIERCFAVFGAEIRLTAWWQGAGIDRLLDEGHALLVGAVIRLLKEFGWQVEVEVSFSDYGDRGSIDILAWHPASGALGVFEVKSEMGGVDPTLRPMDVKARLAPKIAARLGWRVVGPVARILVLPEDRTARRAVGRHATVLDVALPARARQIRGWLQRPAGGLAGIWFLTYVGPVDAKRNPSATRRVRLPKPRSTQARSAPKDRTEAA